MVRSRIAVLLLAFAATLVAVSLAGATNSSRQ
jgi:hypothetical protein